MWNTLFCDTMPFIILFRPKHPAKVHVWAGVSKMGRPVITYCCDFYFLAGVYYVQYMGYMLLHGVGAVIWDCMEFCCYSPCSCSLILKLFALLSRGKSFSKLDLAHAYQQIPLDEESKEYTTINTHKGLYWYNHLPFGVASALSMFQWTIENILQGIPHVCVYIDDILMTGETEDEYLRNLKEVLTRLENANIRLKWSTE